jgi:hypothetical protein
MAKKSRLFSDHWYSDKRFLCQASPVPGLVFLHEHLAEVCVDFAKGKNEALWGGSTA